MKKVKEILKNIAAKIGSGFWLIVFTACFFIFVSFSEKSNKEIKCNHVVINIENKVNTEFIRTENIRNLVNIYNNSQPEGKLFKSLDLTGLEKELQNNSFIETAEVYTNINGTLFIEISGRSPVFRVIPMSGSGFYVDDNGLAMPLSSQYTANVPVITGYLSEKDFEDKQKSPYSILMKLLRDDPLLNPLTGQVNVDYKGNVTLIPKTGVSLIDMGYLHNLSGKIKKIRIYYSQILPSDNWRSHKKLIVKYKGQIILK